MSISAPASTIDAMDMVLTGLAYLAAADPTALANQAQADCLQGFEQADAISTAARARFLGAFTAAQGHTADADYSPAAWLIHRTRITRGAARGHVGWARRAEAHPRVAAALAEGDVLSESVARVVCEWTDRLPAGCRDDAIRSWSPRPGAARTRRTWPSCSRRCTCCLCPALRMTRSRTSRTASCGWRLPSPGRA
jgi:hypothetical protein